MPLYTPHAASPSDDEPKTTTNGKLADGTGSGAYHRFVIDIQRGPTGSLRWSSNGVGTASAINVWASARKSDNHRLAGTPEALDTATNFLWSPMTPWTFIDTASVLSIPDGVKTSGALDFWSTGFLTLLVELIVSVDIPLFTLDLSVKPH